MSATRRNRSRSENPIAKKQQKIDDSGNIITFVFVWGSELIDFYKNTELANEQQNEVTKSKNNKPKKKDVTSTVTHESERKKTVYFPTIKLFES